MPKKPVADPQSCASCRYFQSNSADEYGYCRRFPPVVVAIESSVTSIQPTTAANEWCGAYERFTH